MSNVYKKDRTYVKYFPFVRTAEGKLAWINMYYTEEYSIGELVDKIATEEAISLIDEVYESSLSPDCSYHYVIIDVGYFVDSKLSRDRNHAGIPERKNVLDKVHCITIRTENVKEGVCHTEKRTFIVDLQEFNKQLRKLNQKYPYFIQSRRTKN